MTKGKSASKTGVRSPVQLLLVEDNRGDALLMTNLLTHFDPGIRVQVAADGQAAIDLLIHQRFRPTAMLLDINLPKRNGFEVLAEIRKDPDLKALPVFMVSGSCAQEDMRKGFSLGAASFITKPGQLPELEEIVKRLVLFELPRVLRPSP